MVPADSDRISRVPPYSGTASGHDALPVRGCHPLWLNFPEHSSSATCLLICGPTTPALPRQHRFRLFPVRSPLLRESSFLSLPAGTEMFQFPAFALALPVAGLQPAGLPHSDTRASKPVCSYTRIFAAYRVLHRLLKPRHPPSALVTFVSTYSESFFKKNNTVCLCL